MSDPNEPPSYPGSAPIPRPAPGSGSEHPRRPNLAPPGSVPAPPAYPAPTWAETYGAPAQPSGAPEPYAHWGRRVAATLLDAALLLPFFVVAFVVAAPLTGKQPGDPMSGSDSAAVAISVALYLAALCFAFWNGIVRQGRRGASLGKQWLQIVVVGESDGRPIGALMTFVRRIMHIVDALACFVGYLWPLWDKKRQTFADKIMSTAVLYLPPEL